MSRLVLASSMVVYGEGGYRCPQHGSVAAAPRREADLRAGRFEPGCPRCGAGLQSEAVTEDAPLDPRSGYAASKVAQEHLVAVWARETGARAVALRLHNVYGPGLPRNTPYAGVAALFLTALLAGRAPRVFEDGHQRRDFVHVDDVAAAVTTAVHRLADGDVGAPGSATAFNVGSGHATTVGEMARALAVAAGGPAPVVTGQYRLGDVRHVVASSERLRRELGWSARTDLVAGVRTLLPA